MQIFVKRLVKAGCARVDVVALAGGGVKRRWGGVRGGGHAWGAVSYSRRSDASAAVGVTAGRDVEPTTAARGHRSSSREWAYWQRPSSR